MGQKVNPVGFRIGVNHAWASHWYAGKKNFGSYLIEDQKIREFLKKKLSEGAISKILIERFANRVRVTMMSARPGVIVGRKGSDIEPIRAELAKMTKKEEADNFCYQFLLDESHHSLLFYSLKFAYHSVTLFLER